MAFSRLAKIFFNDVVVFTGSILACSEACVGAVGGGDGPDVIEGIGEMIGGNSSLKARLKSARPASAGRIVRL
jgi:hypothetical protein